MENLKIEYIPIGNIKPYDKNARKHKDFDVDAIVRSIEEFGKRRQRKRRQRKRRQRKRRQPSGLCLSVNLR